MLRDSLNIQKLLESLNLLNYKTHWDTYRSDLRHGPRPPSQEAAGERSGNAPSSYQQKLLETPGERLDARLKPYLSINLVKKIISTLITIVSTIYSNPNLLF